MKELPAYQRLARGLREEIEAGAWKEGERLPSEHELMRAHAVSRNTVRQALELLAAANLVSRHQGRGTFVAPQGVTHVLGDLRSFTQVLRDRQLEPGIRAVRVDVDHQPPPEAREFLRTSRVWRASRVRTGDGRPFCRMDSWLPDHLGVKLDPSELERRQSLYSLLRDLDVTLDQATEIIRAEAASATDAALLEVTPGTPLITIYRWTSDHRGLPVEYVRSASPGDRYEYVVKLRGSA